jgi:VPDSG-CTERM motif
VSTQGVPDGGSAVALLGIALVGIEFARRKLRLRS